MELKPENKIKIKQKKILNREVDVIDLSYLN